MRSLILAGDDGVDLHVASCGIGPPVVLLSGGPGCVHYLADPALAPTGFRSWFPDPRGVGRSGGGPHDMYQAIQDLEAIRRALELEQWIVLGHSWGSDLAVRYALEHPEHVQGVVGIAGHGLHRDREWSAAYEAGKATESAVEIDWVPAVHAALWASFIDWIHHPSLWRRLADCPVPMSFVAAQEDIRPSWPLQQLAELVPAGRYAVVPGVGHDFWASDPDVWQRLCADLCEAVA
jgi:proline iminopeptidase